MVAFPRMLPSRMSIFFFAIVFTNYVKLFLQSMRQKSMVTNAVFESGNMLAGFSVDYWKKGFKGIKDFKIMAQNLRKE